MKFGAALLAMASLAMATDWEHTKGYWDKETITTEIEVTVETPCPTTETVVEEGKTWTKTYTKISTVVKKVPTTIYETIHKPDVTEHTKVYETKVITKEHPVTETKYVEGETVVVTYVKTDYVKTYVPITHWETQKHPDVTKTQKEYETKVLTKEVPTTETKYIGGETVVVTYVKTDYVKTYVPITHWETQKHPDVTKTEKAVEYSTITKEKPVTETKYVNGETIVKTYTTTEVIKTHVPVTEWVTVEGPDVTKTAEEKDYVTITKEKPITVTKTQEGETHYVTLTSTKYETVHKEHTVTEAGEDVTKTTEVCETVYVTEGEGKTVTVHGDTVYETKHKTITETVHAEPSTVVLPPVYETSEEVIVETTTVAPPPVDTAPPVEEPSPVPTAGAHAQSPSLAGLLVVAIGAAAVL